MGDERAAADRLGISHRNLTIGSASFAVPIRATVISKELPK
jgi:hypothetical protein